MGIVGKILGHVASEIAVSTGALDAAVDKTKKMLDSASASVEKNTRKKEDKFLQKNPGHAHLFLAQKRYRVKEQFYVLDEERRVKYIVKGKVLSAKHHLHVYDSSSTNELGVVKEKLITTRALVSMEKDPKDFEIFVAGQKLGKMKSKYSLGKRKFAVDFNGWTVEGNPLATRFKVCNGEETIMEVSNKILYTDDVYFLDITNPADEFLCLLIMLAIDSSISTKQEDTKRAVKRKLRGY